VAVRAEDLDRSAREARQRWTRLDSKTVTAIRDAYARATDALASRIEHTSGPVTRSMHAEVLSSLNVLRSGLSIDTLGALQRGISTTARDSATQAMVGQLGLGPLVGTAKMRAKIQSTADATATAFISRSSVDGLKLSDRVWRSTAPWQRAIRQTVESGIVQGQSAKELAKDLRQYVSPSALTPSQIEEARRRGIPPQPTWQAERLARTEINAASREATIMTNQTNPFYRGVQWVTSLRIGKGTYPVCDICNGLAHGGPGGDGIYPRGQEPTQGQTHPNCRCSVVPIYDDLDTVTNKIGDWLENGADAQPELQDWADWMQSPTDTIPPPVPPAEMLSLRNAQIADAAITLPTTFEPAKTVDDANNYAQDVLGVLVAGYEEGDLPIANRVNADLLEFRRQGYAIPDIISVEDFDAIDHDAIAMYRPPDPRGKDTLSVFRGQDFWKDPAKGARNEGGGGFWTTTEPTHVIRHELGHKLHRDMNPDLYDKLEPRTADPKTSWRGYRIKGMQFRKAIKEQVSEYAVASPTEFVAEMFAGALGGKKFSQEMLDIYSSVGGPPLPQPFGTPAGPTPEPGPAPRRAMRPSRRAMPPSPPPSPPPPPEPTPTPFEPAKRHSGQPRPHRGESQQQYDQRIGWGTFAPTPPRVPPAPTPPGQLPATFVPAATIDEANAYTQQTLGMILSNYQKGDLEIANRVNRDLLEMKRQGIELPQIINVENYGSSGAVAAYGRARGPYQPDVLLIYRRSDFWQTPVTSAQRNNTPDADGTVWWTTGSPNHVVRHELGHKAHSMASSANYDQQLGNYQYKDTRRAWEGTHVFDESYPGPRPYAEFRQKVRKQVSRYASSAPPELVAEMYAGALGGKTYSQEMIDAYNKLGGPPLPQSIDQPRGASIRGRSSAKPEKIKPGREDEVVTRLVSYDDGTAFDGVPVPSRESWSKQKTGRVAENVVRQYLRQIEGVDAVAANAALPNYPVDAMFGGNTVVEIKGGLASNLPKSQQWRLTIGGSSDDAANKRIAALPPAEKRAANRQRQQDILDRKKRAMQDLSRKTGKKVSARTMTAVIDPDTRTADVYSFDGLHQRIDWTSDFAKAHYLGTFGF
jgi:hypothetical protein